MKCRLEIKVIPGASRTEIVGWLGESLKIKVAEPPEKGKANQAIIKLLCKTLALDKGSVAIISGSTSQRKVVEVTGITEQQLSQVLPSKSV